MKNGRLTLTPRDDLGRFVSRACTDPNCSGLLILMDRPIGHDGCEWVCNGLSHDSPEGPLRACKRTVQH